MISKMINNIRNMRPIPDSPLIVEICASKHVVEEVLIYSAIERELLTVLNAREKINTFFIARDLVIRTYHPH